MNPRTPPSGPFAAIGRFSLAAPLAVAADTPVFVPLDRTDFLIGDGILPPDPLVTPPPIAGAVRLSSGLYFAQVQVDFEPGPAGALLLAVAINSLTEGSTGGGEEMTTASVNALRLTTEAPFLPGVQAICLVGIECVGDVGTLNRAELLVYRLADAPG